MFPNITHIDELKEKVSHLPEIRFNTHDNGFTTVCYMISDGNTFFSENKEWARECRGITFNREGKIAARPMHKFFNINENVETQKNNIDFSKIVRRMDKLDGSLITGVLVDDKVILKSKKSFTSHIANLANQFIADKLNYKQFCYSLQKAGFTPDFEFTSNKAKIVLNHKDEQLTLLHVRNNVTGEYMSSDFLEFWSNTFNIPLVKEYFKPWSFFEDIIENGRGVEGFVFQLEDGSMFKYKTKWYLDLHHVITFRSERSIVECILSETIDDIKSKFLEVEDFDSIKKINELEQRVTNDLVKIENKIDRLVSDNKHLERKEFAIQFRHHKYFGLLMNTYLDKEVDIKEFYKKNYLHEFSLNQI